MASYEYDGYQLEFDPQNVDEEYQDDQETLRASAAVQFLPGQDLSALGLTPEVLSKGYLMHPQIPEPTLDLVARFLDDQEIESRGLEERTDVDVYRPLTPPFVMNWSAMDIDGSELEVLDDGGVRVNVSQPIGP